MVPLKRKNLSPKLLGESGKRLASIPMARWTETRKNRMIPIMSKPEGWRQSHWQTHCHGFPGDHLEV
jgi:hypothetical protein